jgi:hypothetical protein
MSVAGEQSAMAVQRPRHPAPIVILLSGVAVSVLSTFVVFTATVLAALVVSVVGLVRPGSRGPQNGLVLFGGGLLVGPIAYSLLALAT